VRPLDGNGYPPRRERLSATNRHLGKTRFGMQKSLRHPDP
jgi:hypothetical protein